MQYVEIPHKFDNLSKHRTIIVKLKKKLQDLNYEYWSKAKTYTLKWIPAVKEVLVTAGVVCLWHVCHLAAWKGNVK